MFRLIIVLVLLASPALAQNETFSNYMKNLPAASGLTGGEPMVILQGNLAHQVPLNSVLSVVPTGVSLSASQPFVASTVTGSVAILNQATGTNQIGNAPVWNRMGVAINPQVTNCGVNNQAQERDVIYDTNPKILTAQTNVFKMWYHPGSLTFYYAESADGLNWTCYANNPLASLNGFQERPTVIRTGSTYVGWFTDGTNVSRLTSTDGITWTLANANVLTPTPATWDAAGIVDPYVYFDSVNNLYYMSYGALSGGGFPTGIASSPDGITWTKSANNPVITTSSGSLWFTRVGSAFWGWSHSCGSASCKLPSDVRRFTVGSDPTQTWSQNPASAIVFGRGTYDEGADASSTAQGDTGQIGDVSLLELNGRTFMWYEGVPDQSLPSPERSPIKTAIANMKISQLVTTNEGAGPIINELTNQFFPGGFWVPGSFGAPFSIGMSTNGSLGSTSTIQTGPQSPTTSRGIWGFNYYLDANGNTLRENTSSTGAAFDIINSTSNTGLSLLFSMMNTSGVPKVGLQLTLNSSGVADRFWTGGPTICLGTANTGSCNQGSIEGDGPIGSPAHNRVAFSNGNDGNASGIWHSQGGLLSETATFFNQAGIATLWDDSTTHRPMFNYNGGSDVMVSAAVATGSSILAAGGIGGASCAAAVVTAVSNVVTSDVIVFSEAATPTNNNGLLITKAWPIQNFINFQTCNPTAATITQSSETLTWHVLR